jgi:pimeloyl-ACP methyl ester carboxylesterase
MSWLVLLLLLLAIIAALPFVIEARRKPVDQSAAPGKFANLSQGKTHYQWFGPARGQVAVCVHGLTTPSYVFEEVVKILIPMGFRVLTYDLFGRGYSDRAPGNQNEAFHVRQLRDLLDHEEIGDDIVLVGYSMGGMIATSFAADQSNKVDRLILLASAGLRRGSLGGIYGIIAKPFVGLWSALLFGGRHFRKAIKTGNADQSVIPGMAEMQAAETGVQGFMPAVRSSIIHFVGQDQDAYHSILRDRLVATLAIWGDEDDVIPISSVGRLAKANRDAHQVTIPGAGHELPYTHPEEMQRAIQDFIKSI